MIKDYVFSLQVILLPGDIYFLVLALGCLLLF